MKGQNCVTCGVENPRPGLRTCQKCADYHRRWKDEKRAQGLCTRCGVESAVSGNAQCRGCVEKLHRYGADHRIQMRDRSRDRKRELKLQAVSLLGGRCCDCKKPFRGRPEVFDFDHRDPSKKTATPARLLRYSLKKFLVEAKNLDLVCANCHRTRTARRNRGEAYKGVKP